jgi:hypothetical protein
MSEPRDDGGPAFPRPIGNSGASDARAREVSGEAIGMSLRDYFAGQALVTGMQSDISQDDVVADKVATVIARRCYEIADAMIAERSK